MKKNPREREIKVWDVFYHKNAFFQRKVTYIEWDTIWYHDWIWPGYCSRWHFLSTCPREVKVKPKRYESQLKDKYPVCPIEETKNWVLDENAI